MNDIKKRIAQKHGFLSGYSIQSRSDLAERDLYAVMDEYAKERLIDFAYIINVHNGNMDKIKSLVELYLKASS